MDTFWSGLAEVLVVVAGAMILGGVALRYLGSAIPGYIVAGAALGPSVLGVLSEQERLRGLAELGVALLLFAIGLEFSLPRLIKLGKGALLGGSIQVAVTLGMGAGAAVMLGLPTRESLVIGAAVALSSTAAVLGILRHRAELDSAHGRSALGVLLLQDLAVVPLLLFTSFLGGGQGAAAILTGLGVAVLGFAGLATAALLVGRFVLPTLIPSSSVAGTREVGVLIAILLGLGATWLAHELRLSPALGAFVAGLALSQSPFAVRLRTEARPLKSLFLVIFFSSIGFLVDLEWLAGNPLLVLGVAGAIVAGKAIVVTLVLKIIAVPLRTAVTTGLCLAQVGEFSFLIAEVASAGGVLGETGLKALISATFVTLLVTPGLIALGPRAGRLVGNLLRARAAAPAADVPEAGLLLIGFGPAGRRVLDALTEEQRASLTVVDLALQNIRFARDRGVRTVLGDATQPGILATAGARAASTVVVALPDTGSVLEIIAIVRDLSPDVRIIARCRYHRHSEELRAAGAQVVDEETVTGESLARALGPS